MFILHLIEIDFIGIIDPCIIYSITYPLDFFNNQKIPGFEYKAVAFFQRLAGK